MAEKGDRQEESPYITGLSLTEDELASIIITIGIGNKVLRDSRQLEDEEKTADFVDNSMITEAIIENSERVLESLKKTLINTAQTPCPPGTYSFDT